ncbi:MAG: hypothetical protein ACKVJX_17715 [Verrucomicrobiia bacterium]|jgi:hypothetical protein
MSIFGNRPTRCKLCGGKLHRRDLRCIDCGAPQEDTSRQLRMAIMLIVGFAVFCTVVLYLLKYLFSKS